MKKATILNVIITLLLSSSLYILEAKDHEVRNLNNFSSVSVATGINLVLVQGSSNEAEIDVDNIELDEIITKVDGGKLTVKVKGNKWGSNWWKNRKRKVDVRLTYKNLEQISASSGANVTSDNTISNDDIELDASSGASINLDVDGTDIEADASSGSTISLSGECGTFDANVSSGARIKGADLEAGNVEASASSGASIRVWAKDGLNAKASSGGSIKYKGNPESLKKKKSSGGSVRQL